MQTLKHSDRVDLGKKTTLNESLPGYGALKREQSSYEKRHSIPENVMREKIGRRHKRERTSNLKRSD